MAPADSSSTLPWEAVVTVREVPALEEELVARFGRESEARAVGVTDLISLRPAFYRAVGPPVTIPAARQARLDEGRTVHRGLGARLAREGILEARVRREGIVGRIDILADVPIEVKTTTQFVEPSRLALARRDHVEQLGMYCALVGGEKGRLLTLLSTEGAVSDVQAVDVAFPSAESSLAEMHRRVTLLRAAWEGSRVDALPRCPWYGRGCEFQEASVCSCRGTEEESAPLFSGEVEVRDAPDEVRARVLEEVSQALPSVPEGAIERFREIQYPRRAYFERTTPTPLAAEAVPTEGAPSPPLTKDLYARLVEALESGPAGEVARVPPRTPEPEEEVVGFRGRPLLVRTSRAWARYRPEELLARAPQYALEMGLRCAATGTDSGLVVVGFERAEKDRDRVQALELRFDSLTPFSRLVRERGRALAEAVRRHDPTGLAACASWMVDSCPYRSECGCGTAGSRVTR